MNITIGTAFKILDGNNEFVATTNIESSFECSNKELSTQKIYDALKKEAERFLPKDCVLVDLTPDEYALHKNKSKDE